MSDSYDEIALGKLVTSLTDRVIALEHKLKEVERKIDKHHQTNTSSVSDKHHQTDTSSVSDILETQRPIYDKILDSLNMPPSYKKSMD